MSHGTYGGLCSFYFRRLRQLLWAKRNSVDDQESLSYSCKETYCSRTRQVSRVPLSSRKSKYWESKI